MGRTPSVPDLTSSGKIPPQARELENAVLGALLLETKAFFDIENILSVEDFYDPINQTIFKAIHRLGNKHEPIDMYTVCQELMKMEEIEAVGGPVYIAQLTDKIASAAHVEYHARIIKQKAIARKLIDEASKIVQMAYDESVDIEEVIEEYEKSFSGITTDSSGFQSVDMAEALKIFTQYANQLQADRSAGKVIAIPTHLPKLNKVLDEGWRGGELIILGARPSMGKALPMNAKVLTPNGWMLNRDLKVGDSIASIDGKESFVTGVYPQGYVPTYEIEFSDGRKIESCGNHLWEVTSSRFKEKVKILSTIEISEKLSRVRYQGRMSIPMYNGDFGMSRDFIIHPYLLGVFLGDGQLTDGASWCNPDNFITEKIRTLIDSDYSISKYSGDRYAIIGGVNFNKYREELRRLDLFGSKSESKFIPSEYLKSSRSQRIELLNGLLDTDGDVDKLGSVCYNTVSHKLAKDVQTLCWSLGYKCSLRKRKSFLKGERKLDSYRLVITSNSMSELFSLPRKKERIKERKVKPLTIVSVKQTGVLKECQCISVSHERSLYVTDDYIVTHNTQHALAMAQSAAKAGEDCFFVSIEMTLVQLITRLMLEDDEINKTNLRTGQMTKHEWETLDKRIGELFHIKMSIADHHNIRYLNNIKSEARRLHRQGKLKIMIIDYLQLIKTNLKFQSRQLEVAYITGELKSLAKELNIPIVALAQLSRPQKGSKPKEPDLEDLREAGDIEQDADIVCMLHLPSYYKQYLSDEDIKEWTCKGMFIVRKSREGVRNDTIIFYHDERYKKIWDDLSTPIEIHNRPPITPNYSFEKQEDDLPF